MEVSSSAFIHSNGHAVVLSSSNDNNSKRVSLGEPENGSILDPFHIEDLLDFSNEDIAGPIGDEGMQQQQPSSNNNSSVTGSGESQAGATSILRSDIEQHANEFSIDCDDMPELEWLSSLVEDDSFCMGNEAHHKNVFIGGCCSPMSSSVNNNNKRHLLLVEESSSMCNKDRFQVGSPISVLESNSATSGSRMVNVVKDLAVVPGRPRSKRQRTGVSTWTNSSCVLNNNNNNNMFMSFSSPATSSVSDYDTTYNIVSDEQLDSGLSLDNSSEQDVVDSGPSLASAVSASAAAAVFENKKQFFSSNAFPARGAAAPAAVKGKPPLLKGGAGNQEVQPRRCTHCLSQKTPQWRAGPEGPKTLCNACGVRFKSGRLFPEYRPALSPTFHSEVHSNSHRKVLEMRRQKEVVAKPLPTAQEQQQGEVLDGGFIYQ